MDYSVLILTIGIPGSGKTTWAKKYLKEHPNGTVIISSDEIRKELTGIEQCVDPSQNGLIHDEVRKRAKEILQSSSELRKKWGTWPTVIIDSTNVDIEEWEAYKKLGSSVMIAKIFDTPPEQAFNNLQNRERKVPLNIIQWKWELLLKNSPYLSNYFNLIVKEF